jgi:hypothetical protein
VAEALNRVIERSRGSSARSELERALAELTSGPGER